MTYHLASLSQLVVVYVRMLLLMRRHLFQNGPSHFADKKSKNSVQIKARTDSRSQPQCFFNPLMGTGNYSAHRII